MNGENAADCEAWFDQMWITRDSPDASMVLQLPINIRDTPQGLL
jgi:hypothetical protein